LVANADRSAGVFIIRHRENVAPYLQLPSSHLSVTAPNYGHGIDHFSFAKGFATSRAQSMKSCATGLSAPAEDG
jgi:hypothetical protein